MDRKYQVFISSTYEDLKDEREQAIKAILEMGHIPLGMEMFSAADEEQWQLIARQIEAADYYVIIIAHRYGSETAEGVSFTEKEYDHAIGCGVPVLGFVIDESSPWPAKLADKDGVKQKKLDKLKSKIKAKLVHFWKNKDDLHGKISISLIKTMSANPRRGWSRADEAVSANVTRELSRLSEENATLREENRRLISKQLDAVDEVREAVRILHANERTLHVRAESSWDTRTEHTHTLLELFLAAAPILLSENSTEEVANDIAFRIVGTKYYKSWPFGKKRVEELIANFSALDLIEPSKKKHPVSDTKSYWSLTSLGRQVQRRSLRIQLEQGIKPSVEITEEDEKYTSKN